MQKKDKTIIDVSDLDFGDAEAVDISDLSFDDAPSTAVMEGGIDHALPAGFGQGAETKPLSVGEKVLANDKSFGNAIDKTVHNLTAPAVAGAEKLLNQIPGVELDFSDYYDPAKKKKAEKQTELSYETYDLVGKLANTQINLEEATPEDVKSYNEGLYNVIVNKLGHKDVGFDKVKHEYVVTTKEGEKIPLNSSTTKQILSDALGDKYELSGALAGAKVGLDASKAIKNPYVKGAGIAVGSAIGAGAGSLVDTFTNAIETGQQLTAKQYGNEANKAIALDLVGSGVAPLVIKGVVSGAKGVHKATKAMTDFVDMAKKFDVQDYAQKKVIDDMAKLPEIEQERYLDALKFAKDNNIRLTSTSVLDHPQIDQLVQVLARNPFIRQGVKNLESKSRDSLIKQVVDVLETAGPKATAEELDPLLKQELGGALHTRNVKVHGLYDDFEKKVSGEVVTKAKQLMEGIDSVGDKYGFREEGGKLLDEDVLGAEAYVKKIFKPRIAGNRLDAATLNKISSNFGKRASSYKVNNPKLYSYYSEAKGLVDDEIKRVSAYEGDDVLQALHKAKSAYKEKVNIYGSKSEYSEIRKAMESDRPNEAISALLTGEKGLDNANMLKQELSGTESGDALIGALGRKQIDDVLANVDMKSPQALGKVLSSDKLKVAKRLLGEESSKKLDDIATLFEMMGRTEKLLSGAGSEIAAANHAHLSTQMLNGVKKMMVRLQQKRLFGKVFDNTLAQDLLYKTLKGASDAKTPREMKLVDSFLKKTARTIEKETGEDFSDIYDKRKIRETTLRENKDKEAEKQALRKEVKKFVVPETEELLAVQRTANNDDVVLLSKSVRNIQEGRHTDVDVERYIKARKSLDDETFSKAYEKEKVSRFPAKYRSEDLGQSVTEIKQLRDYLMSNPELKYGNEFSPQSVNALVRDLEEQGYPRSTKHDALYDEMKDMYGALKERIHDAYAPKKIASTDTVLESPLGADGQPVFSTPSHLGVGAGTGTVNAFTNADADGDGNVTQEEFVNAFILGLAGGTAGSKAIAVGLKKVNPELFEKLKNTFSDDVSGSVVGMSIASFGKNIPKYKGKPKEAITHLMKVKKGQVIGATTHPSLGNIDFVYGDAKRGLKHIYERRMEQWKDKEKVERFMSHIPDIIEESILDKSVSTDSVAVLRSPRSTIILSRDLYGEDKIWMISGFREERNKNFFKHLKTVDGEVTRLEPGSIATDKQSTDVLSSGNSIAKNSDNVKKEAK